MFYAVPSFMLLPYVTIRYKNVLRKKSCFCFYHLIPITLQKLTNVATEIIAQQSTEHTVNNVCQNAHS